MNQTQNPEPKSQMLRRILSAVSILALIAAFLIGPRLAWAALLNQSATRSDAVVSLEAEEADGQNNDIDDGAVDDGAVDNLGTQEEDGENNDVDDGAVDDGAVDNVGTQEEDGQNNDVDQGQVGDSTVNP